LFSIAEQKTVVKKSVNLEPVLENNKSLRTEIFTATQVVMFKEFPAKILVVKELEGNAKKSKLVLISGGHKYGFNKNQEIEAKIKITEEVEGELLERLETIAILSIKIVENENFSQCEVLEGGEKLKAYLSSNSKLYCYPRIGD
jgi:hypothetical protein